MKISIKTLKGEQFQIDVDSNDTIGQVKVKVADAKPELPASRQKLIHSGKVLKDENVVSETGINENEFIVCMITKEAAPAKTSAPTPAPAISASVGAPASSVSVAAPAVAAPAPAVAAPAPAQAPLSTPSRPTPAPPAPTATLSAEAVRQLMDMGFPEAEVRAALQAAMGNSDLAVEYLMSGIPAQPRGASGGAPSASPQGQSGIDQLRRHPQINQLRRLVQSNPGALSQLLESIGVQNPDLLRLIHANQAEFLAMMNEPVTEEPAQPAQAQGLDSLGDGGMPNPMQLIQMIQSLPPDQRAAAAQSLGMTPEQLQAFGQMMASLPPDQMQRLMGDAARVAGGGGGGGAPPANAIRLTQEEMNAVNRLMELGFSQQDAAAAYLACDKNEALAANLLMDGWGQDNA